MDKVKQSMGESEALERVPQELFIGGRWRPAAGGRTFPVTDPATGATLAEVADASAEDAADAMDAAAAAAAG